MIETFRSKIKVVVVLVVLVSLFVTPFIAIRAQSFGSISDKLDDIVAHKDITVDIEKTPLPQIIGNIIYGLLGMIGVVCLLLVIYAGIFWMMAEGNEQKVQDSKNIIKYAIIGLIIISISYAVTSYVVIRVMNSVEKGRLELEGAPNIGDTGVSGDIRGRCRLIKCDTFTKSSCEANPECCFWQESGGEIGTESGYCYYN